MIYGEVAGVSVPLSRLVLGSGSFDEDRRDEAWRLLDRYAAAGGTVIDTAAIYGGGASERVVGGWLDRSGYRDSMVIATKGGHPNLPDWHGRLTPEDVEHDIGSSLSRLNVEYVDLYMLHRDDEQIPVGELIDTLAAHVANGRAKAIGVSNWSWQRVQQANAYASRSGAPRVVANSIQYSLAAPKAAVLLPGTVTLSGDAAAFEWYSETQLPVLAWSSQANGFFSGRYPPDVHDDTVVERVYYHEDNWRRLERATRLAVSRGCTPSQVAMAWLLGQPLDLFAVIGCTQLPHLEESLGTLDLRLTPEEMAWLNLDVEVTPLAQHPHDPGQN